MTLRSRAPALLLLGFLLACDEIQVAGPGQDLAPPRALEAYYHSGSVHLSWEMDAAWRDEPFRVYGRRVDDRDSFLIAEVTSCRDGLCAYTDRNVVPGITYEYYVTALSPDTGAETPTDYAVEVFVPEPVPPPVPGGLEVVALDGALYLRWDDRAREAEDFQHYRVWEEVGEAIYLVGETDSEGFVDLLAENGETRSYAVSSVDEEGHESALSEGASGTPRPDGTEVLLHGFEDRPDRAGFRFPEIGGADPRVHGDAPERHLRFQVQGGSLHLAPAPGVEVHPGPFPTTTLRCGPGAPSDCRDLDRAPESGYVTTPVEVEAGHTYAVRKPAEGGGVRYGALRVAHTGYSQEGPVALVDWAHQLQPDNPRLAPAPGLP